MCLKKKSNKKIIYGRSGYGKSYTLIAPIIRRRKGIVYITFNGLKRELKCMGLPENALKEIEIEEISSKVNKTGIDLYKYPTVMEKSIFSNVIDKLDEVGITKKAKNTIILSGVPCKILNSPEIMSRMEEWKSKVVIECMCDFEDEAENMLSYILHSPKWDKIPVFYKLY